MSEHTWRELERADMDAAAAHRFDEERRAAMAELLPCPFCGGEAEIRGDDVLFVQCAKCGTRYGDRYYATKAEAIAAWNTRAERICKNVDKYASDGFFICGNCGFGDNAIELTPNYCPSCGAKVVGE